MLLAFTVALTLTAGLQQADTTVSVRPGSRLELNNFDGTVTVTGWSRNAVRVETTDSDDGADVEVFGSSVRISARGRHGPPSANFRLTVPADIDLNIGGHSGDVSITGVNGEISVETVEGNVTVKGGGGYVSLHSVEGDLVLEGARAEAELNTVDGSVRVASHTGELRIQTVDGDVQLMRIVSPSVDANTVDGKIDFDGVVQSKGRYRLSSHDGDVTFTSPGLDATVTVSTFDGDFESDYEVRVTGTRRNQKMSFTLGAGSARIELESFDGTIKLLKRP